MKVLLILIAAAVVCVKSNFEDGVHVCLEAQEDGSSITVCCIGWSGIETGCLTPTCDTECQNGGRCMAPNFCNCPENTFGENCERLQCEQEQLEHSRLSWAERRITFNPNCLEDGTYTLLQCDKSTRLCYCVNRWTGVQFVTTVTRGVPDCKHYAVQYERPLFNPKEIEPLLNFGELDREDDPEAEETAVDADVQVTPLCAQRHTEWETSMLAFWNPEPVCAPSGYYVNTRCDYIRGYCICVDPITGEDIHDTKIYSTTIDCTEVSRLRFEAARIENVAVATMRPDGCSLEGKYYSQEQMFVRDCNICTCHGYDVVECTTRICHADSCRIGETNKVVEHLMMNGECHTCQCDNGVFDCRMSECSDQVTEPVEEVMTCDTKPPQTHYYDDCNSCYCHSTGIASCTLKDCYFEADSCYMDHRYFINGRTFTRGCDTLRCTDGQIEVIESCLDTIVDDVITGLSPKVACTYGNDKYYNGESMLLGFKLCNCQNFEWNCLTMA